MMIHSLSLVLVLSFTIAVHVCAQDTTTDAISATSGAGNGTQLPVYPCTSNEGKLIAIGAKFNSSCNSCTCMANGGAVCTEKGCLSACYDDRAKGYGLEESRYDGCYQYLCTPSGWSKPIQICASTGVATSTSPPTNNPTNLPVSSTGVAAISSSSFSASIRVSSTGSNNGTTQLPTTSTIPPVYACTSNEGKPIAVGAGYRGKCNHCTCAANGASMCTLMFCPSPCYDDNGKGYALEQSRYNGCYQYLCTPGGWSKPIQICASTGVATSTPTKQPTNLPVSSTGINNNPTCLKKCTQFCINGLECRDDEMGCKKCLPKLTTNAPTCPENLCEGKCEFKCEANFDTCTYKCKEPSLGETFRTLQFLILYNSRRSTNDTDIIREIHSILVYIADSANIPRSDYVINDKDGIKRLIGLDNSRSGIWLIKMGFRAIQHPDGDERLIFLTQLFRLASPGASIFAESSQLAGLAIDSTQSVTTSTEFMEEQTCDDGRTISATQQCVAVTSTVAISSSSSSTSIPIAAIVAPIVGGVVLLSIIITAFIIIRRRGNAVKTMEGMNREMANFTPIEGEQRV